jgi:hypothetical protein
MKLRVCSTQRLQIAKHRRDQLGYRRMDMHRALNSGERCSCVHDVQNAVDCLVAACPQNRRAEDLLGTGVDQHLHKAFSLALFEGTRHLRHRSRADQGGLARSAHCLFRKANPAERRIHVQRIRRQPVAHAARIIIQQVCRHNFKVVICRVRESAFTVAVFYRSWSYNPELLSPEEIDVYVRAYQQPGAVRGSAMDYRATAEDVKQDKVDVEQLITCPVLVLWGEDFEVNSRFFNILDVWRGMAEDVRGRGMPQCGHLCQEERPDIVNEELLRFLEGWTG